MLTLGRRTGEEIVIELPRPDGTKQLVVISIVEIRNGKARIGVTAPKDIRVDRGEVHAARQERGL